MFRKLPAGPSKVRSQLARPRSGCVSGPRTPSRPPSDELLPRFEAVSRAPGSVSDVAFAPARPIKANARASRARRLVPGASCPYQHIRAPDQDCVPVPAFLTGERSPGIGGYGFAQESGTGSDVPGGTARATTPSPNPCPQPQPAKPAPRHRTGLDVLAPRQTPPQAKGR